MVRKEDKQNPELKKSVIFCTVLRNFVHIRINSADLLVSKLDDESEPSFVSLTFGCALSSNQNSNLKGRSQMQKVRVRRRALQLLSACLFKHMRHIEHAILSERRPIDL